LLWRPARLIEQLPMVSWFEPVQLLATALQTLASVVVGSRSDQRIVQALSSRRLEFYDYAFHYKEDRHGPYVDRTHPRSDIWMDYVCDTGDGWNSTYAVAYALAQPRLSVGLDGSADVWNLPRADILVFGGDEVYPTPSREEYQRRLIVPFETAFGDDDPAEPPHVFAIPGNHDWYDGLSAFARLFCSGVGGHHFAGWRTRQRRSYFALRLPAGWWLIGSDGQLQSDIDTPQIEYFRHIANHHMKPGDRVIMCLAAPVWVQAHKYRQFGSVFDETDLLYLRDEIFARRGVHVPLFLSGDYHHYRRHQEVAAPDGQAPIQKITAGGGGAFLHPTHDEDVRQLPEERVSPDEPRREFELKTSYPDMRRSRRLAFGNLLFPLRNPRFGVVPGAIYLMTVWLVSAAVVRSDPADVADAIGLTAQAFNSNPGLTLWVLAVTAGLIVFTDTHSRLYRWAGGLAHAGAHWVAMFLIGWSALWVGRHVVPAWPLPRVLFDALLVLGTGWLVGSIVMGLYLLISLNVFGRHSQHAFAALRIQDFKNFLRLHIAADGALTLYAIKIPRVPRAWRPRQASDGTHAHVVPVDGLEPALIEPPIGCGTCKTGTAAR
ncbi:MAG: hypothetical protein LC791_03355, partial [Acidobacteria bacterium]|nr:hypothetical protein [Acidobacteriota bacterium]